MERPSLAIVLRLTGVSEPATAIKLWVDFVDQLKSKTKTRSLLNQINLLVIYRSDSDKNEHGNQTTQTKSSVVIPICLPVVSSLYEERRLILEQLVKIQKDNMFIYYDEESNFLPTIESFLEECQLMIELETKRAEIQRSFGFPILANSRVSNATIVPAHALEWYSKSLHNAKESYTDNPIVSKMINDRVTQIYQPREFFVIPSTIPREIRVYNEHNRSFDQKPMVDPWLWYFCLNTLLLTYQYEFGCKYLFVLLWLSLKTTLNLIVILMGFILRLLSLLFFGAFTMVQNMMTNLLSRTYFRAFTPKSNRFLDDFVTKITRALSLFDNLSVSHVHLANRPSWLKDGWGKGKFYPSYVDFVTELLFYQGSSTELASALPESFLDQMFLATNPTLTLKYRAKSNQLVFLEPSFGFNNPTTFGEGGIPYAIEYTQPYKTGVDWLTISYMSLLNQSFTKKNHAQISLWLKTLDVFAFGFFIPYFLFFRMHFWQMVLPLLIIMAIGSLLRTYYCLWNVVQFKKTSPYALPKSIFNGNFNRSLYLLVQGLFPIGLWYVAFVTRYVLEMLIYWEMLLADGTQLSN